MREEKVKCNTPEETFAFGERIGARLNARDAVLLHGRLGAGKTLLTKGILSGLGFDADEVTSPSFTLVNRYDTERFNVFHIDLWRLENGLDNTFAVGLDEIFEDENALVIIEWAELLGDFEFPANVLQITIDGDGDEPRTIEIRTGL